MVQVFDLFAVVKTDCFQHLVDVLVFLDDVLVNRFVFHQQQLSELRELLEVFLKISDLSGENNGN